MKLKKTYLCAALGWALAGSATAATSESPQPAPKPKVRVYTNEDLDRIHPYAAQTGGGSTAATAATAAGDEAEPDPRKDDVRPGGEAYWRAEAARAEERVCALEERAAALRARIVEEAEKAERERRDEVFGRRRSRSPSTSSRRTASLEASLAGVERRIQKIRDDLQERARRAGALPGWLR